MATRRDSIFVKSEDEQSESERGYDDPDLTALAPIIDDSLPVQLSQEQRCALELILEGHNVFVTGTAGCGKSTLLKALISRLRALGKRVRLVASTGRAANEIGGITAFFYAGWTPADMKRSIHKLEQKAQDRYSSQRFIDTDVLIFDEISMVENNFLERLNRCMQAARKNQEPFGGVQVVVCGDFLQLPPVLPFSTCFTCGKQMREVQRGTKYECATHGEENDQDKWAFRSQAWEAAEFIPVFLNKNHRQSEPEFVNLLRRRGLGKPLSAQERRLLLDHESDTKDALRLFATREEVRQHNDKKFERLKTPTRTYLAVDYFRHNPEHEHLKGRKSRKGSKGRYLTCLSDHSYQEVLELKVGMPVILLTNMDVERGLCNGSQGKIVGFEKYDPAKLPVCKSGLNHTTYKTALDYVAMQGGSHATLRDAQVRDFIEDDENRDKMWPIVEFAHGMKVTVFANCRLTQLGDSEPFTLEGRTQIPLAPAWAMTIHKAQGMTLDKVIVDLRNCFERGQAYVALSRARSLNGLKVPHLGKEEGASANPEVLSFLRGTFPDIFE